MGGMGAWGVGGRGGEILSPSSCHAQPDSIVFQYMFCSNTSVFSESEATDGHSKEVRSLQTEHDLP